MPRHAFARRWSGALLRLALATALLLVGVAVSTLSHEPSGTRDGGRAEVVSTSSPAPSSATTGPEPSTAGPTEPEHIPAKPPVRVRVPSASIDAAVVRLGKTASGSLDTPDDFDQAGWWSGGYAPGGTGPAVIVGHVDNKEGPAVFYHLPDMVKGDRIETEAEDGVRRVFVVQRVEQYRKVAFPTDEVYGRTERPSLRLVTCGGAFDRGTGHYLDNVVVYAELEPALDG